MSTTSKSPIAVLRTALAVGEESLRPYSHRFSPQVFTQPQLFACLVLKEFLRLDYRKLAATLQDAPEWTRLLGLRRVPHFTTFQKAARRLLRSAPAQKLLDQTVTQVRRRRVLRRRVKLAAIDGTGFESRHVSFYYVKRRAETAKTTQEKGRKQRSGRPRKRAVYHRFPKAGIVCDCASHLILSVVPGRGPRPDDLHYRAAVAQAAARARIDTLLADAGYDGEPAHEYARDEHGMRTIMPPTRGRPTNKLPTGRWRRRMATHFNRSKYGQRWQAETVNSMLKRLLDSALRARKYWTQCREILLRAITHNVMILWNRVFYRAAATEFLQKNGNV